MRLTKPVVALSAAAVLAACGGGSGGVNRDSGAERAIDAGSLGDTGHGQDPEREGPVTIEGAEEGGVVTVLASTGLNTSIDPQDLYHVEPMAIMTGLVTRQLTQYAHDRETGSMVLVPDLATDLGTPNEDFTEWTFQIREGVRWETGEPVTAEDVARGMIASMDAETFPEGPGPYYSKPYFLGGEEYEGPFTAPETEQEAVTVDGNTITVRMSRPFPDFPYYASFPAMGPRPAGEAGDPATYAQDPLATGPYKIASYTRSKSLVLERNPEWDPATDPARTQYPDGYEFSADVEPDQIDQILLADQGEGETTMTYDDIQAQNFREFRQQHPDRLVLGGSPCTSFLYPDYRKITDKEVREALVWAYPYRDIILATGQIPEVTAIPATNVMPPGIPGREHYNPVEGHGEFETDPDRARALLEESGNLGMDIRFLWRTDSELNTRSKDVLVKALETAGFTATPVATTDANYWSDLNDPDSNLNLRSYGWCSDWPSGATWIPTLFASTDVEATGFGTNLAAFREPEVDQEIEEVFSLPAREQPAAWAALGEAVMTEYLPVVPLFYSGVVQAHGSRINGHHNDSTSGEPTYKEIWVSSP